MAKTPHWDTPYGTPRSGGKSKLLALFVVMLVGGGFCCMGFMFLGALGLEDTKLRDPDALPPDQPDEPSPESAETQAKNAEVAKLEDTANKFKAIIRGKLDPVLNKLRKQRAESKRELLALKNKSKLSSSDRFKAKKLLEEFKEISKYIKRLNHEKEKYEQQVLEIEFATRKVKRQLEVSEFLDEGERKEVERLLAKGSVLLESADKGFDQNSLEAAVASSDEGDDLKDAEVDLADIDAALEEHGED